MSQMAVTPQLITLRERRWGALMAWADAVPEPKPARWGAVSVIALGTLILIWAVLFTSTWGKWGSISVDNGREIYAPWELAQGKTLYRDLWYTYSPGAPYLNSLLFRIFGTSLTVLYWAGSLSALGCAILLYLTGGRLSSWPAGWTAGAVVLAEAFVPSLFCFPLPYSYAAVYGCVATCLFVWCSANACRSSSFGWLLAAGGAAAAAFAFKTEFGAGCYLALGALVAVRACQAQSFRRIATDLLLILPAVGMSAAMIAWMISLRGAEFITQENIMSWPSNYFMKTYGARWLRLTGLGFDRWSLVKAAAGVAVIFVFLGLRWLLLRYGAGWRAFFAGFTVVIALILGSFLNRGGAEVAGRFLFLPPAMVLLLLLAIPAASFVFWRRGWLPGFAVLPVLLIAGAGVAARIFAGMNTILYPVYYNGPVILAYILFLEWIVFPSRTRSGRMPPAQIPLYAAVVVAACIPISRVFADSPKTVPLRTDRGEVHVTPSKASQYTAAIQFMKNAAAAGQLTMSIPEDVGLYFFSGTHSPTRLYVFVPGATAPGKMLNEEIRDIERARVQYLIWSNRSFPEYGSAEFGVDFDRPLGDYFRSHFRPVRPLAASVPKDEWSATIWERKPER